MKILRSPRPLGITAIENKSANLFPTFHHHAVS